MRSAYRALAATFAAAASLVFTAPAITTPAQAREVVPFNDGAAPGTIIVKTNERKLYLVLGQGRAVRYTVGVGRSGRQWAGRAIISGKHIKPAWSPPPDIKRDNPRLPNVIAGGAPSNPMGVAALTLSGGDYAIHGTNNPGSIGGFVSYGCIRMYNHDIMDLYARVTIGTPVIVAR